MILNAVYPNSKEDWSELTFRTRPEGGTLIEADYEIRRFKQELRRRSSYEKPDPTMWDLPWGTSNASYDPQCNSINVYAGFLTGDLYREDMTREELMAGVGMVIAHELSHAFDTKGSKYDETGALRDWWTEADQQAFDRRVEKLIACYDRLHPWKDGSSYSGTLVQQEAIADLGAMACILRISKKTEGFDYDAFFRAFTKLRRCKMTETAMENRFRTNPHPMDHLRVNVVAAQFPEFQETYDIRPGDGMYVAPEDRISIWGAS